MRKTGEIKRNGGIGCRNVVCAHRKNEREEARHSGFPRMNKISHLYTLMFRVFAIRLLDNFVI